MQKYTHLPIRPAKTQEIDEILNLTRACAKAMISNGIYQWNAHYPSRAAFENDFESGELYVLDYQNKIIGTITISQHRDADYGALEWLTPLKSRSIYIHRLAVHPEHQGQGHAQTLMDFAETEALREGFTSVRLDTFSQNPRNQHFYEQRGYSRLGDIFFPKQSKHPFHCYELVLKD